MQVGENQSIGGIDLNVKWLKCVLSPLLWGEAAVRLRSRRGLPQNPRLGTRNDPERPSVAADATCAATEWQQ